jgi:hypothetical protein
MGQAGLLLRALSADEMHLQRGKDVNLRLASKRTRHDILTA